MNQDDTIEIKEVIWEFEERDNKVSLGKGKICQIPKIRQTKEGKRINSHFQQHFAMFLRTNYEKR